MPTIPNTSATGGVLQPAQTPAPLEDPGLTDFFQGYVSQLTGISKKLIFPRWQTEPPNLPKYGTNWAAIGITDSDQDTYAALLQVAAGEELQRHEVFNILASFYGPSAQSYASLFSDNLQIGQNRALLTRNTMGLVRTGKLLTVPALIKQQWTIRVDISFRVKRGIKRIYPVLTVNKFTATIETDCGLSEVAVVNPPQSN